MNLQIVVITLFIVLLIIGNEVTKVRRKLNELGEKLGQFQIESKTLRDGICGDLKHEIEMHEIRTGDLHADIMSLGRELGILDTELRENIRRDLKHEIQMHEIRTSS
jgi:hypothetical protein